MNAQFQLTEELLNFTVYLFRHILIKNVTAPESRPNVFMYRLTAKICFHENLIGYLMEENVFSLHELQTLIVILYLIPNSRYSTLKVIFCKERLPVASRLQNTTLADYFQNLDFMPFVPELSTYIYEK